MRAFADQVVAAARQSGATTPTPVTAAPRLRAHCRAGRVVAHVGPEHAVARVGFAVGHRRLGQDRTAPYRVVAPRGAHGRVTAVVHLTSGERIRLSRRNPGC